MKVINTTPIRRVLQVNDISCFGKCSLTVSIPILSRFGFEAVPLPTAILSTHTGDFSKPTRLDMTEEMKKIIAHWESFSLRFDGVYTGYLLESQVELVEALVRANAARGAFVMVDPVMGDNGYMYSGFSPDYAGKVASLIKNANVITPNLTEAALLTGTAYKNVYTNAERKELIRRLCALGSRLSIITGVRPNESEIGDVLADSDGNVLYESYHPFVDRKLHGCGDVFASVCLARMLSGEDAAKAVENTEKFILRAIAVTNEDSVNHWYGLKFEGLMDEITNP